MKRYLEINAQGVAFHQPAMDHPFSMETSVPPTEIHFCDCQGVGVVCHHVYAGDPEHEDETKRDDRHFDISGPHITEVAQSEWKTHHSGPRCSHRRQIFVDVTNRPEAQRGMRYDEPSDTFYEPVKA